MGKRLVLLPRGWPLPLSECPPGPFLHGEDVCFNSEYRRIDGTPEAYCSSGEAYHGTGDVQPLVAVWESDE